MFHFLLFSPNKSSPSFPGYTEQPCAALAGSLRGCSWFWGPFLSGFSLCMGRGERVSPGWRAGAGKAVVLESDPVPADGCSPTVCFAWARPESCWALPAPWCLAFGCRAWDASTGRASAVLGGLHHGALVLLSAFWQAVLPRGGLAEAANPQGMSPPSGPDAWGWHRCRQRLLFILNNFSVASYSIVAPLRQGPGKHGASCSSPSVAAGEPSRAAPIRAGLWHEALGAAGDPLVTAAPSCSCPGFAPWVGLFSPLALRTALV